MSVTQSFATSTSGSDITLEEWNKRHPISYKHSEWRSKEFSVFINALVYPKVIKDETAMQPLISRLSRDKDLHVDLELFDWWRNHFVKENKYEDNDRYEFQTWIMLIFGSWLSVSSKLKTKEPSSSCRKGVESIIELAFQLRTGADQVWQQNEEMVLPDEPESVMADSIASMSIPRFWQLVFSRRKLRLDYPFSWSYSNKPQSTVTFVFVASEDDTDSLSESASEESTLNRLQMCFYSAQMHRRALCCKDGPVFGATLHRGTLQFYVSFWDGSTLAIRPVIKHYPFENLFSFIECYFALCRISEYQSRFLQEEFQRWEAGVEDHMDQLQRSAENPWRPKTRGDLEPVCCVATEHVAGMDKVTGIDVSRFSRIRDRRARLLLESVRRSPYSPDIGYPLTRKNKKAFDVIARIEDNEEFVSPCSPEAWVEETYKYKDEYEDPAPFCFEGDVPMDCSVDIETDDVALTLQGDTLSGTAFTAETAEDRIAEGDVKRDFPALRERGDGTANSTAFIGNEISATSSPEGCIAKNICAPYRRSTPFTGRPRRAHSDAPLPLLECKDIVVC